MLQNSIVNKRLAFEKAQEALANAGYDLNSVVLTEHFLRSEFLLNTTSAAWNMPILQTDTQNGNPFNTEVRLALQDSFVLSAWGLYVGVPSGTTDATWKPCTYNNPAVFVTGASAAALWSMYNGKLTISVNQRTIVPGWPLLTKYVSNQTQQGVGVTAQTIFPIDQNDYTTDAQDANQPSLIFVGSTKIQATIVLPEALPAITANSRAVIIWYGHLAQNSTSVNNQ